MLTVQQVMLPQQLNDWRFRGSLRPSSDISYIDFLNSELNFKLSSYFEKPFKLNNSKKTPLNTTKLNQPHLCYSLPIVCSVFPSCFQASTHFHIEIPSNNISRVIGCLQKKLFWCHWIANFQFVPSNAGGEHEKLVNFCDYCTGDLPLDQQEKNTSFRT